MEGCLPETYKKLDLRLMNANVFGPRINLQGPVRSDGSCIDEGGSHVRIVRRSAPIQLQ